MKNSNVVGLLVILLVIMQVFVVVGSWIANALSPESGVVSMLSSEGVRWFVGSYARILATPLLIYIILIGVTIGVMRTSRIADAIRRTAFRPAQRRSDMFFEHFAIQMATVTFLICIIVISLLTFLPHAVLLNAHGSIFHSSFSRGFIPMVCFSLITSSIVYAVLSSRINNLRTLSHALTNGIAIISPLILLYILAAQLYFSITYVLP